MDQCPSKRGSGGLVTPRKAYSVAFKGAAKEGDQNAQFCNRIGCSGRIKCNQNTGIGSSDCKERIKCNQNTRIGSSDKAKCFKPSFRSSNGNETSGKSPRISSMMTASTKKSSLDSKRKLSSQLKFDPSESSLSSESEDPETTSSPMSLTGYDSESTTKPEEVTMIETGSSSISPNARPRKIFHHKSRLCNQNTQPASSVPSTSRVSSVVGQLNQTNESKYGLKNLKCNSISDVVRPNCSPVGKNLMRKRSSEGESSFSHRGRKTNPSSPSDRNFSPSSSGVSISNSRRSSSASGEDSSGTTSAWAHRSMNVNTRMRLCHRQNGRNTSAVIRDSSVNTSQTPDNEMPFSGGRSSLRQFSASGPRASSLSSSNGDNPSSIMPFTSAEPGFTYRYNMDGIAEVLALLCVW